MALDLTGMKRKAAERAVTFIHSGQVVGLGEGSTANLAIRHLAELLRLGRLTDIVCIPTSLQVERLAQELAIPLTSFEDHQIIDITIDGADEVDHEMNLIKGGGGALLREKIVAQATRREIIVVDETKCSAALGTNWAAPVEVMPFGWQSQRNFLKSLGADVTLRLLGNGQPFETDQGNVILDSNFGPISNPVELSERLSRRAGIVEHGLFLNLATDVIEAGAIGIRHIKHEESVNDSH